jgi:hypothetical protein
LGGKQAIELKILAVGASPSEVNVHACLDPALVVLLVSILRLRATPKK